MKYIQRIVIALTFLSAFATSTKAATSNVDVYGQVTVSFESTNTPIDTWDEVGLQPLVHELTALGWSTLRLGTGSIGLSVGIGDATFYEGRIELDINTGEMVFTVTDEGARFGSTLRLSANFTEPTHEQLLTFFLRNVRSFAETGSQTFNSPRLLSSLVFSGAHHRPLMLSRFPKGSQCMWVTGDVARNNDANSRKRLGEIGVCKDFSGGTVRAGMGLGVSAVKQELGFGGDLDYSGNHLLAEVDLSAAENLLLSLTGMYGRGSSDIRRVYPSLLSPPTDVSIGSTDASTVGVRVRADWLDAVRFADASLNPYVAYTHLHTRQDAYTETGGASPAHYNAISADTKQGMIGLAINIPLSARADLAVSVEGVHIFDAKDVPVISGQATGLPAFSMAGAIPDANYVRVGVDFDFAATKSSTLNFSAHFSDIQPGPAWSGSVSWRVGF